MEAGDSDDGRTSLRDARGVTRTKRIYAPKQGRTKTLSPEELLRRVESRIAELFAAGRVQIEGTREVADADTLRQLEQLRAKRHILARQVGPAKVQLGMVSEIHHHGTSFRVSPFLEAWQVFARVLDWSGPTPKGPTARRDRLIWMLWHFRHRAVIDSGRLPNKVRGGKSECFACGHRHRTLARFDPTTGEPRGCPRCGNLVHKTLPNEIRYRPYGRVTKVGLRRRFRVSERELRRILSASPLDPPATDDSSAPVGF